MMSDDYLAGLFDGEGWVSVIYKRNPNLSLGLFVGVKMTHRVAVEQFQERFGGSVTHVVHPNPNHSDTWTWRVTSLSAMAALETLEPRLLVKKPQAEVGLMVGEHLVRYANKGKKSPPHVLDERERLLELFKSLPKRGGARS